MMAAKKTTKRGRESVIKRHFAEPVFNFTFDDLMAFGAKNRMYFIDRYYDKHYINGPVPLQLTEEQVKTALFASTMMPELYENAAAAFKSYKRMVRLNLEEYHKAGRMIAKTTKIRDKYFDHLKSGGILKVKRK